MNRYHRNEPEPLPPDYRSPLLSGSGLELVMVLRERTAEIRNEQQRQTEIALATLGKVDTLLAERKRSEKMQEGWLGAFLRLLRGVKDAGETVANIKELLVMVLLALLALRIIYVPEPIRSLIFGEEKHVVAGAASPGQQ